ncbi:hypothetical protein C8Q70DRAFT_440635 [Cubamyces menziesii]|nr:hypothetical protein C8Q70DRAFT_440635 [Cubamyces menziesii]
MLIEAATTPADERAGPDGHMQSRPVQHAQHLHPSSSSRPRSPSPGREYHLTVPGQHGRSRAHSSVQLPSGSHTAGPISSPPGPLAVPGQVQTYQTHIFAPPVTGAPVKKSKLSGGSSTMSANGSLLTLGPTGSVISGPSVLGGGGFPPTNEAGQRICRQCGLPGRYKEGKCVEKWGPGPEGPGTVCDRYVGRFEPLILSGRPERADVWAVRVRYRCRKKMKRVERRGTLDNQAMAAQLHHQHPPAAVHPSSAAAAQAALANGRASTSHSSIRRSDTVHIHPSSQSQSQSRSLGATSTHLLSSSGSSQNSYVRHDRERDRGHEYEHPASPHYSSSRTAQRTPPTPPYIATLPGSGANDDDAAYDEQAPRGAAAAVRGSRATSRERPHKASIANINGHRSGAGSSGSSRSASHSPAMAATTNNHNKGGAVASARGSPRGSDGKSKSSELMDVDADADADGDGEGEGEGEGDMDAEAEADAEADAEAELLEAVDAAEANNATDEEWLKKEDA